VVALLRDPEAARRKGLEGRARVAAAYDWDHWLSKLVQLVESPMGEPVPVASDRGVGICDD
jgi:hypothetical protein